MENNRIKIILLLLAVTTITLSVFLSVTIYSYHQISDGIDAKKVYLNGNLSHINSAQGNLFYRDFIAFSGTRPALNGLRSIRQELDENFAAKTFYRSESNHNLNQIQQILQRYERKIDIIDEILEAFREDITLVKQHSSETRALVRKAAGGINENSDLTDFRNFLNEINQLEVRLGNAEKSLNARRGDSGNDTKAQLENKFVHVLETAVKGDSESLGRLKSEIETLTNALQTVRANHSIIIRDFHSRTGLVNIVVNNLQPVTNNLGNWIRPVQNNIRTLEQPILPGVTGLSMIRSIDPVTYQAIILIRDTNNAILRLDNEMNDLVRNVISMQNISGRYQNQQNRSNQRDFVRQAAQTRSYLNGKITLFDPTIENLNRALGQIANYQRAVSGIRNRTVSNMLQQIGSQSSTTMNNIMAPMRAYRDNVNKMISDLGRVAENERTYESILNNVTSFQYANRAATDAVLPKTLTIQKSGDYLRPLFFINSIGLFILGIIAFLLIRQRDNGTVKRNIIYGMERDPFLDDEAPTPVTPFKKDYPDEKREEEEVADDFGEKEEFAENTTEYDEVDESVGEDDRLTEFAGEKSRAKEAAMDDDQLAESDREDDWFTEKIMDDEDFAESVAEEGQIGEYSGEDGQIADSAVEDDQFSESAEEKSRAKEAEMDDLETEEPAAETTDIQTEVPNPFVGADSRSEKKEMGWEHDDDPEQVYADNAWEEYEETQTQWQPAENDEMDQPADARSYMASSLYGFNEMLPGYLLILNGQNSGRRLALYGKRTGAGLSFTIGRDVPDWQRYVEQSMQDVHLRIADETQTVSRLQAEITYRDGKCYLRNLSKSNPTVVNDMELSENQSVLLEDGTIITAGHIQMQYHL